MLGPNGKMGKENNFTPDVILLFISFFINETCPIANPSDQALHFYNSSLPTYPLLSSTHRTTLSLTLSLRIR
jgi:hypothetical protein